MAIGKIVRRTFLGVGVAAAGGVAFGWWYVATPHGNPLEDGLADGEATFNPWVKIASDGTVTIVVPRAEMGQGVTTTLAALVAEELDVRLDGVVVEHGPPDPAYYNAAMLKEGAPGLPWESSWQKDLFEGVVGRVSKVLGLQVTGGSSATVDAFDKMRQAGAAAREVMKTAAANRLGGSPEAYRTEDGAVIAPDGTRLGYGELAPEAAELDVPSDVALRDPAEWKILGRSQPRVDMVEKVMGERIFAIDVELPEMLHATVRMSPVFGGRATSADETAARAVPGVVKIVPLETQTGNGFAVVATNTWAAFKGAEALAPEWEAPGYPASTADMRAKLVSALDAAEHDGEFEMGGAGEPDTALDAAPGDEILEAEYHAPHLAHATLEPQSAVAELRDGRLRLWIGGQAPGIQGMIAAPYAGVDADRVEVINTRLGGGFGRRGEVDFAIYAAAVAAETDGRPVKLTWTREEDQSHDVYRPMASARLRAHVRPGEGIVAVDGTAACQSAMASVMARTLPSMGGAGPDKSILDGMFNQPYGIAHRRFRGRPVDIGVPVGFWRAVGNSQNAFFWESFVDEAAHRAGLDPMEARLRMTAGEDFGPARRTLDAVARMSDWGTVAEGRAKGVAFCLSFGTWVAQVVEVSGSAEDGVTLENVWVAADLGRVLDPRNVEGQMVSGVVYGLSAAIMQEVSFEGGQAQELNFWDYDCLRMQNTPPIHVELLQTSPFMGGAGEPGLPPAAPALGNAIFALTGQRLRETPFSKAMPFA